MKRKIWLGLALILVIGIGLAIAGLYVYSRGRLQTLLDQTVYASPEQGMRELVATWYSGVDRVEIVHADKEFFDDLRFVVAHVWAASRSDGKRFSGQDYDNPGCYFLRLKDGWVLVPESCLPWLVAIGKHVFGQ